MALHRPRRENPGLFIPLHFRSRERKVHRENFCSRGTFVPWNIRSLELSLLWNFCSSGANVPRTFVPMKLSFHENQYSKNFRSKCPKTRPETGHKPYNSLCALITSRKQFSATGAKALSTSNYRSTIALHVITSRVHRFMNFSAVSVALT